MAMLDRLAAEEDIGAATVAAVARNMRPGQWCRDTWRRWERLARPRRERAVKKPSFEDLAAAGVAVRVVERTKTDG